MGNEKDQLKSSNSSLTLVKGEDFHKLCEGTYFNASETEELFILFYKACTPMKELNAETFNSVFPSFKKDYRVQKSLFDAMDNDKGGTVAFPEFLKTLGQMFRGTVDEKADLALSIIDLDGDKKIQRQELYDVCKVIEEITKGVPSVDNITPAEQVVDSIFDIDNDDKKLKNQQYLFLAEDYEKTEFDIKDLKGTIEEMKETIEKNSQLTMEQKINMKKALFKSQMEGLKKTVHKDTQKELDYEEFKRRAKTNVQFLSCFGMFTLFYHDIVLPIEKKLDKNVKKFGYPAVEGNVKCKALFKNEEKYCQIQNGMMVFYDNYKHCYMNERRWVLDDSGLTKRIIPDDDDFSKATFNLVKDISKSGIVIGIHNFSKYTLDAPTINFSKGSAKKKLDLKILTNSFGTGIVIPGGLLGSNLSGYLSYRIADSGSRLILTFDMGITGKQFACRVVEEDADVSASLIKNMKQTSLRKGTKDWIQHEYHMKAIVGKQDGKLSENKCTFRVEFHDATECAPPIHTLDLTEAICKVKPQIENGFTVSRSFWSYDFILEDQPELRDNWVSCIAANTNVTKLYEHPFHSFSPVRENAVSKMFMCGKDYFEDLAENLKKAEDEILITGWFISPMFHLTRNKVDGEYIDRLDHILLDRAEAGCRIYVLAWDELDAAFYLASKEMKQHFEALHPRIQVSRDPLIVGIYSHHQKTVIIDQQIAYVGGIDLAYNRYDDGNYNITDEGEDQIYPGRHYVNPMIGAKNKNVGNPLEDVYDRSKVPRMPWQDYQAKVIGEPARDVARNFIQRWLICKEKKHSFISLRETDYSKDEKLIQVMKDNEKDLAEVQVIRCAAWWSLATSMTENSIFKAEVKAIKESKHFVYIENQFFVSSCDKVSNPRNKLIGTLVERVAKAIENKEPFRAIFLCPLHSSSPLNTKTLQNLTYWQLSSMFQGPHSMLGVLQKRFPDVDVENYVTILCLRNWGKFKSGIYCNEMVYIHSKLMIVDDSIIFCSSANVNDRSMLGDRDSEIGVKIIGHDKIDIKMGGETTTVSRMAHDLRVKAMSRFSGKKIDDPDVQDAVVFYDDFRKIAQSNQEIYVDVFQKTVENLEEPKDAKIIQDYNHNLKARNVERLQDLQGYVVPYPKKLFSKSYSQPDENHMLVNFYC